MKNHAARMLFVLVFVTFITGCGRYAGKPVKEGDTISARKGYSPTEAVGTDSIARGTTCTVRTPGTFTVVGVSDNAVLVRYTSSDKRGYFDPRSGEDVCPSGVVFFIGQDLFQLLKELYLQEEKERNLAKELLDKESSK